MNGELHCPGCGARGLLERLEPQGTLVCPSCGATFRRGFGGLSAVRTGGAEDHERGGLVEARLVRERLARRIADKTGKPLAEVLPKIEPFIDDDYDSLDLVEAIMALEEEFEVELPDDDDPAG